MATETATAAPPYDPYAIRQLGEKYIDIPFTGFLELNIPKELLQESFMQRNALNEFELQIGAFASNISGRILSQREILHNHLKDIGFNEVLLPWLIRTSENQGRVELYLGQFPGSFDMDKSLLGQSFNGSIRFASFSIGEMEVCDFFITSIVITDGSIKAKIKGILNVTALSLTLFLSGMSTPYFINWYSDQQHSQKIEVMLQDIPHKLEVSFLLDKDKLQKLGIEAFNYAKPGISGEEKALRVCIVQISLKLAQGSPNQIDGILGPQTRQALIDYSKRNNLPSDISNETLRAQLLRVLQNTK